MDYKGILNFVKDYNNGQNPGPYTAEEQRILKHVRYISVPCASNENRHLTLFICRHLVDFQEPPFNQYQLVDALPLKNRRKPRCSWALLYRFVDENAQYSDGGEAAKRANYVLRSMHPTNVHEETKISKVTIDNQDFWRRVIRLNKGLPLLDCNCGPITENFVTQSNLNMIVETAEEYRESLKNYLNLRLKLIVDADQKTVGSIDDE